MSDPDVQHAGWAVDATGSRFRRRRNPVLLLLAVLLIAGGTAAAVAGIVGLAVDAGPDEEDVVARGVVAALGGPDTVPVSFRVSESGRYTVWLRTDAIRTNTRETIVASVACRVVRPDAQDARFRGSRQGSAATVGDDATIGVFTATAGTNRMACRHLPFGRRRLRDTLERERPYVVVRGEPSSQGFLLLFGGIGVAVLGVPLLGVWRAGRLRPR